MFQLAMNFAVTDGRYRLSVYDFGHGSSRNSLIIAEKTRWNGGCNQKVKSYKGAL